MSDDATNATDASGSPLERLLGPLPEDTLRQQAFVILSRLQSGTEDVVRLDAALAAVAAMRELCAQICDQRSADHWHDYKDRASPFRGDTRTEAMSDEAEECAKAIRGPNVGAKRAATAQPLSVRLSDQFGHTEKD